MSAPDREIDIRAFLQKDRERILRAIRKRVNPHLVPSGYFKGSGEQSLVWIDRLSNNPGATARSTALLGFVAKTIIGIEIDGIVVSEDRRSRKTLKFSELPYEDLMKVSNWVARQFPAPAIEREAGMQQYVNEAPAR